MPASDPSPSSTDLVQVTIDGGVATVSLNRPDKRNALNDALLHAFLGAFDRIEAADEVRVVVLQGAGSSFCAGVDLAEKLTDRGRHGAVEFGLLLEAFSRLEHHRNPIIAVLQGTSLAGGWELALHCDIRFAAPDARFGMPLARLGLVVPYPAAARLVQIAGLPAATDLLLSADLISGERAYQLGLATHLVPLERLYVAAMEHARRIAALAPLAVRETKRLLAHLAAPPGPADYAEFDEARRLITASADTEEGLRAFVERRAPTFLGR